MPFPLGDLRRSYGRSGAAGGPPDVRPYLLAGAELAAQLDRLRAVVTWHRERVGQRRREIDADGLARLAGDYRLARCLAACLQSSFRFVTPPFDASPSDAESPSDLRLRVFERVARDRGGFAAPEARADVLEDMGGELGLGAEALDRLLWHDAEGNQLLEAIAPAPSPAALAATYNRRALSTLLVRALSADLVLPDPDGAAIRRLYFLVKRHGLLCDLSLVEPEAGPAGGVRVHLFGPLEVFGPRTRHGERFAGVLLGLLFRFPDLEGSARVLINEREYRLVLGPDVAEAIGGDDDPLGAALSLSPEGARSGPTGPLTPQPPLPEGEGESLSIEDMGAPPPEPPKTAVVARPELVGEFDSEVEARLFATLRGMARRGDAAGWTVEREPEPLIHGTSVMVPDFLLSRPAARGLPELRVFVEVIGFWTPAYRERKREKLRQVGERVPLVLVVQEALAAHFADLPFPLLTYKHRVAATDLVRLLTRHYVRPEESAPAVRDDLAALVHALDPQLGFVGLDELRRALELPTTGALTATVSGEPQLGGGWRWVPGAGVAHDAWLEALRERCAVEVRGGRGEGGQAREVREAAGEERETGGEVALEALRAAVRRDGMAASQAAAEHLEGLLPVLGYEVSWQSLFDATVRPA